MESIEWDLYHIDIHYVIISVMRFTTAGAAAMANHIVCLN